MKTPEICIRMPEWLEAFLQKSPKFFPKLEGRMQFVINLARHSIGHNSGGPFAAGVFDEKGTLIAAGVNLVLTAQCSVFHAEIVALALAQKILGRYDISDGGKLHYELVTTAEPCAMCFGAIHWSGIRHLACGARDEDARAIGFDEGPKIKDWVNALKQRGTMVERDVLRDEAIVVLKEYSTSGGIIYNPGNHSNPAQD
jgi:tRNA(Arg) A34 adenosine deaminase TadA